MSHHLPGRRKPLAQARRNKSTTRPFRKMNRWRVKLRNLGMAAPKLQLFFVSCPFQDLFFLVGQEPVALLVDLVEDLVDPLLRDVGDLFEGLSAGDLIIEFVPGRPDLFFLFGVEKIVAPVEDLVHPNAAVMPSAHLIDKEKSGGATS